MKKIILIALLILSLFSLGCAKKPTPTKQPENTLYVYNWEDYISPQVVENFEKYYEEKYGKKIKVVYTTFDTNETMLTKVTRNDAAVDLICPSEYAIEKLAKKNLIENISELAKKYTANNFSNIEQSVVNKVYNNFDKINNAPLTDYMIPYMWGTLGLLYNKEKITESELEKESWGILWNSGKNKTLYNKILLKDSVRDTYAAALFYMKEKNLLPKKYENLSAQQLINTSEKTLLKAVEKVLIQQRSIISGYEVDFGKDDLINGLAYADLAWSGDAMWAISENKKLGYYLPKYSNIWFDGWVIPKTAQHKKEAMEFLNYLCMPENAILNSTHIGYTSAVAKDKMQNNESVKESLKKQNYDVDEYFSNTSRYPSINDNLGMMKDFGKNNTAVVQMWERVKAGKDTSLSLLYITAGISGIFVLIVAAIFIKEFQTNRTI